MRVRVPPPAPRFEHAFAGLASPITDPFHPTLELEGSSMATFEPSGYK
jgi:hypothetical protein